MIHVEKQLEIAGAEAAIVTEVITLELNAVGRADFRVRGDGDSPPWIPPEGEGDTQNTALHLASGYRGTGQVYPLLSALVTETARSGENEWRIVAREPGMLLELPANFALRHVTPAQVLAEIEEITGLRFIVPEEGKYLRARQPYFYAEGTCRQALDAMAAAWSVPRAVWASLPDASIFWGDWADSPFNQAPVKIDPRLVVERDPEARALVLPWMPRVRPGIVLEEEFPFLVERAVFSGSTVRVSWGEVD